MTNAWPSTCRSKAFDAPVRLRRAATNTSVSITKRCIPHAISYCREISSPQRVLSIPISRTFLHPMIMICSSHDKGFSLSNIPFTTSPRGTRSANHSKFTGLENIRIPCQLPQFCGVFGSGCAASNSVPVQRHVANGGRFAYPSRLVRACREPNGKRGLAHLNGGSLNARNLRECSFAPSRRSSLQASIPMRICSLIARS